jgi:AcrR family transcriptional regulator
MINREIPGSYYNNETQNMILNKATELFALKGFGSVTMRDIAKAVGIKMGSIYYYYEGKEAILEDVLVRFENSYRHYFDWLTDVNKQAESLEELMDNMFNREFLEMRDPMNCLSMSFIVKEQHNHESIRKLFFDLFIDHSVVRMQADFDHLIDKGLIPRSDTKTLATIFMFCVIAANDVRIHEYVGAKPPIYSMEFYNGLKKMLTMALTVPNSSVQ